MTLFIFVHLLILDMHTMRKIILGHFDAKAKQINET